MAAPAGCTPEPKFVCLRVYGSTVADSVPHPPETLASSRNRGQHHRCSVPLGAAPFQSTEKMAGDGQYKWEVNRGDALNVPVSTRNHTVQSIRPRTRKDYKSRARRSPAKCPSGAGGGPTLRVTRDHQCNVFVIVQFSRTITLKVPDA